MVPLIDEDEEVEAASFMPSAFRSNGDSAFRKWKAGDIVMRAVDAQIGGGTFGEQQKKKCFVRHTVLQRGHWQGRRNEDNVPAIVSSSFY